MPRRKAGTSLPVARRATTMRWHRSFPTCGGAEGSSRCAGMSLPYGLAEMLPLIVAFPLEQVHPRRKMRAGAGVRSNAARRESEHVEISAGISKRGMTPFGRLNEGRVPGGGRDSESSTSRCVFADFLRNQKVRPPAGIPTYKKQIQRFKGSENRHSLICQICKNETAADSFPKADCCNESVVVGITNNVTSKNTFVFPFTGGAVFPPVKGRSCDYLSLFLSCV